MGFTLVELLISIAIVGIVTSLVLVKYGSFDSTVLLKSLAYEIALTLREAQVRSVSVSRSEVDQSFDQPFGVTFSLDSSKQYTTFRYANAETDPTKPFYYPRYDTSNGAQDIRTFIIPRTMQITDLCITEGNGNELCLSDFPTAFDRLDVSFRRPKFKGLFFAEGYEVGNQEDIQGAKIEVGSATGFLSFIVEVTSLGQISVYKAP